MSKSLTRCTNVGTPARSARASPSIPSRSAPTATTVRAVRRVGRGVQQGLEVRARAGHQDDHAQGGLGHGGSLGDGRSGSAVQAFRGLARSAVRRAWNRSWTDRAEGHPHAAPGDGALQVTRPRGTHSKGPPRPPPPRARRARFVAVPLSRPPPPRPASSRTGRPPRRQDSLRVPPRVLRPARRLHAGLPAAPYGSLRLWDAGVTWQDIETSPGVYDWSRLDTLVAAAHQHGTQVTAVLAMTPWFYSPATTCRPPTSRATGVRPRDDDPLPRLRAAGRASRRTRCGTRATSPSSGRAPPQQLAQLTQIVWQERNASPRPPRCWPVVRGPDRRPAPVGPAVPPQVVDGQPVWRYVDATGSACTPPRPTATGSVAPRTRWPCSGSRGTPGRRRRAAALPIWSTEVNYGVNSTATSATPITSSSRSRT